MPEQNRKVTAGKSAEKSDRNQVSSISSKVLKWTTAVLLAYFGARLVFFAVNVSPFVPPDEVTHAGLCRIFSKVLLLPDNSPSTYEFGLVTNVPWLYYWSMGKLLHLNFFGISDLVFLRLINIPLAFCTVFFALRTMLLLTRDRLARLLLLIVLTNTAMFSLLSASVSYDNLTNLLAAMAVYYLFAFIKLRDSSLLAAAMLCQLAGALTKATFLPLILALDGILLLHEARHLSALPSSIMRYFRQNGRRAWVTALLLLAALALNLQLYGGNYLKYHELIPSMAAVTSSAAAMNYRLDARGTIFNDFKEGKISYMDALVLAGEIKHPNDKADTFYLLMNYQKMRNNPNLWMGPLDYGKYWLQAMITTIFGIKGHMVMFKEPPYLLPIYALAALAALGFVVRWRPRDSGWLPPGLAAVALFYAGFLLYQINYDSYLTYGEPSLTVYGRYLFPIMVPVAVLFSRYLLLLFHNEYLRRTLTLAGAMLFIAYDFPWFLAHVSPSWYEWTTR